MKTRNISTPFAWARLVATAIGLLAMMMLSAGRAAADTEYFVVVSSLRSQAHAQAMLERAEREMGSGFQIARVTTGDGSFLRVMAGPYLTRGLASAGVSDAKDSGFDAAWLLASSAGLVPATSAEASQAPERLRRSALSRALAAPIPGSEDARDPAERVPRRWSTTRRSVSEQARAERAADYESIPVDVVPVLIQQVPEDYRLHRLERD
jgi:hypothetical protein